MSPATFFLAHFLHFFYFPNGQPWYTGAVWSNVFVIAVLAPLGYMWSKTKYWPLNAIHSKLDSLFKRHDAHTEHLEQILREHKKLNQSVEQLHAKHDALRSRLDRRDSESWAKAVADPPAEEQLGSASQGTDHP